MYIHETPVTVNDTYINALAGPADSVLIFDIETTGFKAKSSDLYMIGCAFMREGEWYIKQYMAVRKGEELEMLKAFAELASCFRTIVHFNGDRFDIPYLEDKYSRYELESPFKDMTSVDLFKSFRPLKKFLKLDHMNQKALELFLGLGREDPYDGGALIKVYKEYLKTQDDNLAKPLLLHNFEDVKGMFTLSSLGAFLLGDNELTNFRYDWVSGKDGQFDLIIRFDAALAFPVPLLREFPSGTLYLKGSSGSLKVPLLTGELKYFIPDYKNYYYLPEEDYAIHKSVASFVDKDHRENAKADTCYIRKAGNFLPQPEAVYEPALRRTYDDPLYWFELAQDMEEDAVFLEEYAKLILMKSELGNKK